MGLKDAIIEWLMDSVRVPTDDLKTMVDSADRDKDGFISMRELYSIYKEWRS